MKERQFHCGTMHGGEATVKSYGNNHQWEYYSIFILSFYEKIRKLLLWIQSQISVVFLTSRIHNN